MTLAAAPGWTPPLTAPAPRTSSLADALVVPFSVFDHKQDTRPKAKRMRWPELAVHLQRYEGRRHKDGPGWSPAIYREGATRGNEGVEWLSAAVLDVDHVEPEWGLLDGYEYVVYQTFGHAADDPRCRIVLPFFSLQPAAGWGETWARIRAALCPGADPACKDPARFHYLPSHPVGETRRAFHRRGRLLDPSALPPLPEPPAAPPRVQQVAEPGATGTRPGDDFNARGDLAALLTRHGWQWVYDRGGEECWRRPGKREGISATTNYAGTGLLYIFTSNAPPFEPNTAYTKFHAYALLEHGGDFSAAAKALAAEGYGEREHELDVDLGNRTNGHATARELSERSEVSPATGSGADLNSPNSLNSHEDGWPTALAAAAFHGLAGDVVRAIAPHTEADPAAVLLQYLAAFANAAGPSPHAMVGATRHGLRMFVAIVGRTARARKGDSWQFPAALLRRADPEWFEQCVTTGLSTGEGLINAVRDAGDAESAPPDRRVLAVETEFGRTLRVMGREGNTLSAVLRDAWDGRDLRVMTRGTPLRASGAHVGAIVHITAAELKRELASTDASNGFANRIEWACAHRSKQLPDPEPVPATTLDSLAQRTRQALERARLTLALQRDEETRALWTRLYPLLTEERDGLAGDVLARSEAHVLRLSMAYALLDGSKLIRREHLLAGVAVWDYCAASVVYLFGDSSGDAVADDILRHLATAGELSRTDLSNRLGRHVRSDRLRLALDTLERSGQASRRTESTDGRPAEVWRATGKRRPMAQPLLPVCERSELSEEREGA